MPATKTPASKASAKPAKKAPGKTVPKKAPAKAAKPVPAPKAKSPAKSVKRGANPLPPKKSPVKNPPAKSATKSSPAAKKAPASKKDAAAKKPVAAAKKEPAKKEPAKKEPAKKAAPVTAKAPPPAPAPKKETTAKKGTPPARSETASAVPGSGPKAAKGSPATKTGVTKSATPSTVNGGAKITTVRRTGSVQDEGVTIEAPKKPVLPAAFLKRQRQRLVELRDAYMNSAEGVANDQLRNANEGGDASAFGMHQADAGSDAYDRDFALSLLAKEQDAIYEINEALKRIDLNTYGLCEMSGHLIPEERLEALPFTRFTVQCQERIEREQMGGRWNRPVRSLFGLDESAEDSDEERDEEETTTTSNSESLDFSKE